MPSSLRTIATATVLLASTVPANAFESDPNAKGRSLSQSIQKLTGMRWLTNAAIGGMASLVLSARTHGKVKVKVHASSVGSALHGDFDRLEIEARNGQFHGIPFGTVRLLS